MIGFIGGGNMAEALIRGITSRGRRDIIVSEPREDRRKYLESSFSIRTTSSNPEAVSSSSIVILAVKPQNMDAVLTEISDSLTEQKVIVSIAAGITLSYLSSKMKTKRIIRVMPNTPALVQEGISVLSLCECLDEKEIGPVREIFMSVGRVLTLPEKQMDAVTALSGSGPAFMAFFVETLADAGTAIGLSAETASELATQTFIGTGRLLETGMPPARLREMVTSPGGTTAAGLRTFAERGLGVIVAEALLSAKQRAEELGRRE